MKTQIMKRLFCLSGVLILLCGCVEPKLSTKSKAEVLRAAILDGTTENVLVVAHRGDWRYAPENSLAAIEHSIDVGVDVVEIDLQLTKDSVLVVMHDATLDRTTTGTGRVSDVYPNMLLPASLRPQ